MTIASTTNKSGPYNGNGATTEFAGTFKISDQAHVKVILADEDGVETVQTITTHYTVSGVGGSGFTVTMLAAPATSSTITLIRDVPFTQEVDLQNQGAYYAETIEEALDAGVARDQQLQEQVDRSVKIPASSALSNLDTLIADITRLSDSADEIDTVAGIANDVQTVAAISTSVTAVVAISDDVETVALLATAVSALAAIASDISTVAGIATDVSAVADLDGTSLVAMSFTPTGTGADAVTIRSLLERVVTPEMFGAVGDGTTDDGDALAAAIATGENVYLGKKTYVCGQTLTLATLGQKVIGTAGMVGEDEGTRIIFTHTLGPAFVIPCRSCGLAGLWIDADEARRTSSDLTGVGVLIAGDDVAAASYPSLSRVSLDDVYITRQPSDGFHAIGTLEHSKLRNVTVADCMRHGFVHDGGTVAGYTNKQLPAFQVNYERCRAIECAGNAFIIRGETGFATQGVHLLLPEALGCGWDTTIRLSAYQMIFAGQSFHVEMPDVEDQQYAESATSSTGMSKTSRATPSSGITCSGNGHVYSKPYFSSLIQSLDANAPDGIEIYWPRILAGNYGVNQTIAITIQLNCRGAVLLADTQQTTGATLLVRNQCVDADITIDGERYRGLATTVADWKIIHVSPPTVTLTADTANFTSDKFLLAGQGGAADGCHTMRIASGVNGYAGLEVTMFYAGQDITFSTAVNIAIIGGGSLSLTAANPVVRGYFDGTKWWLR